MQFGDVSGELLEQLKIRLGLKKPAPPTGRLVVLLHSHKFIVLVPTVVGHDNGRWRDLEKAVRLSLETRDEEIGVALQHAFEDVRVDRAYRRPRKRHPYGISPELQALTGCKRTRSFYSHVKYAQASEEDGRVACQASIGGALYTHTPVFGAPLADAAALGKAVRDALKTSKFR